MAEVNKVHKQVEILLHPKYPIYTVPHNHNYLYINSCRRYLRKPCLFAATYVGMVMWDSVGYSDYNKIQTCTLCLLLPSLHVSDFYGIFYCCFFF